MKKLFFDLKFSLRLLCKNPSFTAISLVVIILGLALYICTYSMGYNFSSRPLPYENGSRFVVVKTTSAVTGLDFFGGNYDTYALKRLEERATSFSTFGAYRYAPMTLSDGEFPHRVNGAQIMPKSLAITKVQPLLGRVFQESDAIPGAEPVAVLGYELWQNFYAADEDIIGTTSRINGKPHRIVGVMPEEFDYPLSQEIWLPLNLDSALEPDNDFSLAALAVLKPDTTFAQASLELTGLMNELKEEYPEFYSRWKNALVVNHTAAMTNNNGVAELTRLLNYVILALVILNLASLLFIRAHGRRTELAVRNALGANKWQTAQQILLESFILCFFGLLVSLVIADIFLHLIQSQIANDATESDNPGNLQSWINLSVDTRAIIVGSSVMLLIWITSGLSVAFHTAKIDTNAVLADGGKGGGGQRSNLVTRIVVGIEVIASFFLLIICCLVTVSIVNLYRLDFGTSTDNISTGIVDLNDSKYSTFDKRVNFLQDLQADLVAQNEFTEASYTSALPSQFGTVITYNIDDRDLKNNDQYPSQAMVSVADNYFSLLDVPLKEGRNFDSRDTEDSLAVVIVDEILAEQLWENESAIGKRIQVNPHDDAEWLTIVGVNSHIIQGNPFGGFDKRPSLYRPARQYTPSRYFIVVQPSRGFSSLAIEQKMKSTVKNLDRDLAIISIRPLERVIEMSLGGMDLIVKIMLGYGLATLVFSVVGVYGLIARSVSTRTQEIGIRKALGSSNFNVVWLFIRQGLIYLMLGSIVGGLAAILVSNLLTTYFDQLLAMLPIVTVIVIVFMSTLILLASYLPARKAASLEPGNALRYE